MRYRFGLFLLALAIASAVYLFFALLNLLLTLEKGGDATYEALLVGGVVVGTVALLGLGLRLTREARENDKPSEHDTPVT